MTLKTTEFLDGSVCQNKTVRIYFPTNFHDPTKYVSAETKQEVQEQGTCKLIGKDD